MGSAANVPIEVAADQPTVEERRALIDRVAASAQFRRSARLRDFLLYVGGQSLKEGCPQIHEQEIGAMVFGRSSTYDRSQDNIVRVNATELRKRIEQYFATEGAQETLLLEIPRGGYKPVFRRRSLEPQNDLAPPAERASPASLEAVPQAASQIAPQAALRPVPQAAEQGSAIYRLQRYRAHVAWAAFSLLLAICCLVLLQQDRTLRRAQSLWEGKPAVGALWADFIQPDRETAIVLADASVSLREDIAGKPMSLPDYVSHNYADQIETSSASPDRKADLLQIFNHNLVAFGDVRAAQQILALAPGSTSLHLTLSRFFTPDAIKRKSFVLIGGKKANPWTQLFDDQMNFSLDYDKQHSESFVANRHVRTGEQPIYAASSVANGFIGYSVVAYLPNPGRTGNVIILAGTDSDATSAAAEFVTSEKQLSNFLDTIHLKKFPYFEVLLKTSRMSGTSFNAELVSYRTYPDLH